MYFFKAKYFKNIIIVKKKKRSFPTAQNTIKVLQRENEILKAACSNMSMLTSNTCVGSFAEAVESADYVIIVT